MDEQKNDVPMIEEYRHESAMVHETKKICVYLTLSLRFNISRR